jgi:hypothetical protein
MLVATQLDLTNASLQDVFDYVVFAILQQGTPAYRRGALLENPTCFYRREGTLLRCGIGHLMSDAEYRSSFEGRTITSILLKRDDIPSIQAWINGDPEVRSAFLDRLQVCHDGAVAGARWHRDEDNAAFLLSFRQQARDLAVVYKLDASIVAYREA